MTEYKKYTEYKDSGIEGLESIPEEWNTFKLANIATFNDQTLTETTNPDKEIHYIEISDVSNKNGICYHNPIPFKDAPSRARRVVQKGDILISTVRTYLRAVSGVEADFDNIIASTGFAVARPRNCDGNFLKYALLSNSFLDKVVSFSIGVSYPSIKTSLLSSFKIPVPPLESQHKIVEFLDAEIAHIDAGIANMESLIALLTEKRVALISEVVTRGIPGEHTEFKDSGVDWLGDIPVGWEVTDPKNAFIAKSMHSLPEDTHLMASQKYGVIPQAEYLKNTGKRVVEVFSEDARFKHIDKDDFLIHLRSFQGGIEHCINVGKVTTAYTVVSPNFEKIFPLYAKYLLKSKDYISGLASTTNQLRDGQSIKWKDFRKVILPVPSLDEQRKIANFLERELRSIELISSEAHAAVGLLKEKRQTLISDVVTGKIDVTNSTN